MKTAIPITLTTKLQRGRIRRTPDNTTTQAPLYKPREVITTVTKPAKKEREEKVLFVVFCNDDLLSDKFSGRPATGTNRIGSCWRPLATDGRRTRETRIEARKEWQSALELRFAINLYLAPGGIANGHCTFVHTVEKRPLIVMQSLNDIIMKHLLIWPESGRTVIEAMQHLSQYLLEIFTLVCFSVNKCRTFITCRLNCNEDPLRNGYLTVNQLRRGLTPSRLGLHHLSLRQMQRNLPLKQLYLCLKRLDGRLRLVFLCE